MSKPLERQVIEQARALIADPAAWTQGEFARDVSGNAVSWRSREAVQFCLWGALNRAAYEMTGDKRQSIALADKAAAAMREPGGSLSRVNDTGTHRDVIAIFDGYLRSRARAA
jgi:hypothetical protein